MRLRTLLPALVGASASGGDAWPWRQWCHDKSPATYDMCSTRTRGDLPTVSPEGSFGVSWLRRTIALDGPVAHRIADAGKFWHSSILIQDLGSPMVLLLQYEALNFEPSSFFPEVSPDRKLVWNNTAVVGWIPSFDPKEWALKIQMGKVSGSVLNKWFDWVPGFGARQPGYSLWSVWDRAGMFPTLRNKFESFRDSCCHRFTEDGLRAFHDAGADFSAVTQPLCRNYFALIKMTLRPLAKVDPTSKGDWKPLVDYYDQFSHLIRTPLTDPARSTAIYIGLVKKFAFTAYLADSDLSNYYIIHLGVPYVTYLLQRMILPWQSGGTPSECWTQENISIPAAVRDLYGEESSVVV